MLARRERSWKLVSSVAALGKCAEQESLTFLQSLHGAGGVFRRLLQASQATLELQRTRRRASLRERVARPSRY